MKLPSNILRPWEWPTLAGGALAAVGVYLALIQPSVSMFARHDEAVADKRKALQGLAELRRRSEQVQRQIADSRRKLVELGGAPPLASDNDVQIARITSLARACGIIVDQYVPIDVVQEEDHQAAILQFAGRGDFTSVQRFFRRFESEVDFVDVTHFAISNAAREGSATCQVHWSCRLNGMRPEPPGGTGANMQEKSPGGPPPAEGSERAREVALHEP